MYISLFRGCDQEDRLKIAGWLVFQRKIVQFTPGSTRYTRRESVKQYARGLALGIEFGKGIQMRRTGANQKD